MVHLRNGLSDHGSLDPREFLDLDEEQTAAHLKASEDEIRRLFGVQPQSFVAPAWGYRTGVTKRVAAKCFPIIVDSSQHVEDGSCDVLGADREGNYLNAVETFRAGERTLTYSNPEFWQCYASAGIPIHYMQHTDYNWEILRKLLKTQIAAHIGSSQLVRAKLLIFAEDAQRPIYLRAICAGVLAIIALYNKPASWRVLFTMLSGSSLYRIHRAMKKGGYKFVTLKEFHTLASSLFPGSPN